MWERPLCARACVQDVTYDEFAANLQLLADVQQALSFGSARFGVRAPSTSESDAQNRLVFRSVCHLPGLAALGCETAFGGVFARGISAATTQVCADSE